MTDHKKRIEPVLSNRPSGNEQSNGSAPESFSPQQNESVPIRWAVVLIIVLLSLLVSNQVWERVQEYRAQKMIEQWAADAEQALLEAQQEIEFSRQQAQAQQAARQQQQREARASSSRGKWLAKNCADWRRANDELPTRTTAEEVRRHCAIYESYLETGR